MVIRKQEGIQPLDKHIPGAVVLGHKVPGHHIPRTVDVTGADLVPEMRIKGGITTGEYMGLGG